MTAAALIANGLIGLLLLAALAGGWRLSRKLDALRDVRAELRTLAGALDAATERAEAALALVDLKQSAARAIGDELSLMTEVADNLARRLETAASSARPSATSGLAARVATFEAMRGVR